MRKLFLNNKIHTLLLLCLILILANVIYLMHPPKAYARVENEVRESIYYPGAEQETAWSFTETSNKYTPIVEYTVPERTETEDITMLRQSAASNVLMFSFTFPENATKAVISTVSGYFATDTCFSVGGESGYWLNQAGYIDVYKNDSISLDKLVLLQLSESYTAQEDTLYIDFYNNEEYVSSANCTISLSMAEDWVITCQEEEPILKPIVNDDGSIDYSSLTWELTGGITDISYEVSLYRLVDGTYVAVTDDILAVTVTENATSTSDIVTVATGTKNKAPAGTYQLCIKQTFENSTGISVELDSANIPFFVSYR